jgi:7,8-dihydro-6-hydroxymethylpterin-pyrophosphokinase
MDIDIVIFDDQPCDERYWEQAFVVIPLAEIYPGYKNPLTQESLLETATRLRERVWMAARPGVFGQLRGNQPTA